MIRELLSADRKYQHGFRWTLIEIAALLAMLALIF
jgi:hypothetical protein